MTDYALYVSHTPASAEYGAFTLSVTCDSDMAFVPRRGRRAATAASGRAPVRRKRMPTVEIAIPENTGEERTLSIWVNGVDTKKTVKQGKQVVPLVYSVVWSEGVSDRQGRRLMSLQPRRSAECISSIRVRYGFALPDPLESKPKYGGVVYGPTATEMAYADIPYGDTDPCSLVAPAGTWRMPTADESIELTSEGSKEFVVDTYRLCSDGEQDVYLVPSGQSTGSSLMLPTASLMWSSDAGDAGKARYLAWSNTATGEPKVSSGGTSQANSMMVRCVRAK